MEEAGDSATDDEKTAIEAAISEADEALKVNEKEAIEAASAKLTEVTGPVAQKMYQAQANAAQDASADSGEQSQPGDDAVDAEFEEVNDDKK